MNAIADYMQLRQAVIDLHGNHGGGYLPVRSKVYPGEVMDANAVYYAIRSPVGHADIDRTTNAFRRLFATALYDAGVDDNITRLMMCHDYSDIAMTAASRHTSFVANKVECALFARVVVRPEQNSLTHQP